MSTKRTDELQAGDRVRLPGGRARTVSTISPSGYVNRNDEPILTVYYAEGATGEWGEGNTGAPGSPWKIA